MTNLTNEPDAETDPYDEDRPPSKSQRKRDMQQLKDLAVRLTELTGDTLERIEPPELLDAVKAAARIHRGSARKRQIQYIAKLLSKMDIEPITTIIDSIDASTAVYVARFHQLEQWRERLIEGDAEAMSEICSQYPDVDRPRLRQLIRQAVEEKARDQQGAHFRKLFQFLKQLDD